MSDSSKDTNATEYRADQHVDEQSGARVPTPDPKDQTGDPEEDTAAMRELRKRQNQRAITES